MVSFQQKRATKKIDHTQKKIDHTQKFQQNIVNERPEKLYQNTEEVIIKTE